MSYTAETEVSESDVIKVFEAVLAMPPRAADIGVIVMIRANVEDLADYLWDHWMGEPEEPGPEAVLQGVLDVLNEVER